MGKRSILNNKDSSKFLVVGGHSPIAQAIANRLVQEGRVLLCTRKIDDEIRKSVSKDILLIESDIESLAKFEIHHQELLNNVNSIVFAHRYRGNSDDMEGSFKCEVLEPYNLVQRIKDSENGGVLRSIVFFTSPAAKKFLGDQPLSYHLTKAAISQLIRVLSVQFAKDRISVVGVSPGSYVMKKRSEAFYRNNKRLKAIIESKIPSEKFVTPEEIAELVAFAATLENLSLSGNILNIDHSLGLLEASTLIAKSFNE